MIGRTIRVLEGNPSLVISIFYPTIGGDPVSGLDLYAPCQTEVATVLMEMGVNLENLNITDNLMTSESTTVKKGIYPVILFSPGFGVERDMYLGIISKIVPKGYMVVTISAPHESVFTVYPDGSYIKQALEMAEIESTDYASWDRLLESRAQSITEVIKYLETLNQFDTELEGLFDLDKVAAIGHSLGGAAVLEVTKLDNLIKAAILLDPSFHLIRRDNELSSVPVLLLRQEASTYREMAASMNEKIAYDYIDGQRYAFKSLTSATFYRVSGAQHMSFSDVPLHYSDHHALHIHTVTVEATTAFIDAVFHSGHMQSNVALQLSETIVPISSDGDPILTER
ncbi:alpha/beta hydrolase family protein [Paenibacillus sp. MMO-177]|uniref:alpha/beta hydrolase family protein n=1 Tax=Paenibacillus sp. MMO-177 TaxID=3081289 RepID=UPI0030162A3D